MALNMVKALSEKVEKEGKYTSEMSNVAGSWVAPSSLLLAC